MFTYPTTLDRIFLYFGKNFLDTCLETKCREKRWKSPGLNRWKLFPKYYSVVHRPTFLISYLYFAFFSAVVKCPSLNNPARGSYDSGGEDYGASRMLTCSDGYRVQGKAWRECREDGTWSGSTSTCEGELKSSSRWARMGPKSAIRMATAGNALISNGRHPDVCGPVKLVRPHGRSFRVLELHQTCRWQCFSYWFFFSASTPRVNDRAPSIKGCEDSFPVVPRMPWSKGVERPLNSGECSVALISGQFAQISGCIAATSHQARWGTVSMHAGHLGNPGSASMRSCIYAYI